MLGDSNHDNLQSVALALATSALVSLRKLVGHSRKVEAAMLRRIAVVDRERYYLHEAVTSMFAYMVERLGFAEGAA